LAQLERDSDTNLVAAIHCVFAGERNAEVLCKDLDPDSAMIIETILPGLANPATLQDLLSEGKNSQG
jgi:hypothetical protein